jgi:hypothetical protein
MNLARYNTAEEALLYFADCSAGVCESLASKRSASKSEFKRQGDITRGLLAAARRFGCSDEGYKQVEDRFNDALDAEAEKRGVSNV